ncbi:MAG: hydrogenase iron-sulfur subunit [Theionarchaea archaeon]|nr:MAG: methyl-viologen-reducing hydrogenase subunit delta [Theionarchaea archaeon DG-70-1]MBU7029087.1 hydrogenase iron-sulfur subunit [Theionarchaea archaeon]
MSQLVTQPEKKPQFEPKIAAFLCNWCSYAGADLAGTSRIKYPPNVLPIRVMCSGRVDPLFVMEALRKGADGVLIAGCHPGDCHYQSGNYKMRRRILLLTKMLEQFSIDPRRVRYEFVSASEGQKFASVVTEFVEEIKEIGPNPLK